MRIKIISLFSFIIIWFGFVGLKLDLMLVAPFIAFYTAHKLSILPTVSKFNFFKTIKYFCWLIKEIIMSAIIVSKIAWRRNLKIIPSIILITSKQNSAIGIVTYSNSITLTPGTVTLSVENNKLLVHALDTEFLTSLEEGDMDKRVREIII